MRRAHKIIWTCWLQGRERAPAIVRRCLNSWERNNPGWDFRCLDHVTASRYVSLDAYIDLTYSRTIAASLSDVLRIALLHEYGGVWVDATLFCNKPLDDWLPAVAEPEGFFAFAKPADDRPLSSWFLSADPGSYLVSQWARRVAAYWAGRAETDDYFWFHHLFADMCASDSRASHAWSRVPKISADGPHALQESGCMLLPKEHCFERIDWNTPVFKLVRQIEDEIAPGSLLEHVLRFDRVPPAAAAPTGRPDASEAVPFASLRVATENLGDHVQILAADALLARLGVEPDYRIDRDTELETVPTLRDVAGPVRILLSGWFKSGRTEWPPSAKLDAIVDGFHIRLFQCPELVSDASLSFFGAHEPIGCRDTYTTELLRSKGIDAFTSQCLSLTLPRRFEQPDEQTEIFVVSRDERLETLVRNHVGPHTFVSHYSGSMDFEENMQRAAALLELYRSRARLVVTTLLHCALPAMAMGIPVVVFFPINDARGHDSDRERFSSLCELVPVYELEDLDSVDWNPAAVDVAAMKFRTVDRFCELAQARFGAFPGKPLGAYDAPVDSLAFTSRAKT